MANWNIDSNVCVNDISFVRILSERELIWSIVQLHPNLHDCHCDQLTFIYDKFADMRILTRI